MPQTPKAGDRISVTIEGIVSNGRQSDSYIVIKGQNPDNRRENIYIGLSTDAAKNLKILPREPKVGDAVRINSYKETATVKALADGQALVKWVSGGFSNYPISQLKLVEGCNC